MIKCYIQVHYQEVFMIVFFIILLVLFGLIISILCSSMFFYQSLFKKVNTNMNTDKNNVAIKGLDYDLLVHTRDNKIMEPLLEAKKRWKEKELSELFIETKDKQIIHATLYRPDICSTKVALLVHGFTDSANGMAYLAEAYVRKGFSVLSIDMRGHGDSEAKYMTLGYKDGEDLLLWIDKLKELFGNSVQIVLHGVSMGSSVILRALTLKKLQVENIILAVCDCPAINCKDGIKIRIQKALGKSLFMKILGSLFYLGIDVINFLKFGFFLEKHDAIKEISMRNKNKSKDIPIVFFNGEEDLLTPVDNTEKLFIMANEPKKAVFIQKAPHIGSYFYNPELYFDTILGMISKS